MYLGIDVGGTKTLIASFDDDGTITGEVKFPTAADYTAFLDELKRQIGTLPATVFAGCAAGIPAMTIDRSRGIGVKFSNLPWTDVPIGADIGALCGCPVFIENDAKLAGLSEATLLRGRYERVLYMTVSTGIGFAFVNDGVIDTGFGDAGGRGMPFKHDGKEMAWEEFASGRAIVQRYGKKAADISDEAVWREICDDLALGMVKLIAEVRPEVVVIGGAVGTHFKKYGTILADSLVRRPESAGTVLPELAGAQRPEEAGIYGCYDLIRLRSGDAGDHS
jgi:predicted NBD/HSP70 family sugar kinase